MSTVASLARAEVSATELWKKYPRAEDWPQILTMQEAAAYLRVCYHTVRTACLPDRNGQAQLRHQRLGSTYRIRRADLDRFGCVTARGQAA